MSESNLKQTAAEMTPALRKALVELGASIPITPQEVELANAQLGSEPSRSEIETAFEAVLHAIDETQPSRPFMRLDEAFVGLADNELAMAARNGGDLDAETLARIERDVADAIRKPPQN